MRRVSVLCVISTIICLFGGCSSQSQPLTKDGMLLDTLVSISLYDTRDAALLEDCMRQIEAYEALFSRTREGSDVWRINHAQGEPVTVSPETAELIRSGLKMGELSDGAFDITIAPLSVLWDFAAGVIPPEESLAASAKSVDYRLVETQGNTVRLPGGMALDLGGIAKGYIADRLAETLRARQAGGAIIDLGGNIVALGSKKGEDWVIGIRDPRVPGSLSAKVRVRDQSVVTSGIYERSFEKDGILYHHLLDPATGQPVHNGLASVTIVSPDSLRGDALSTACFILGPQDGMALVESLDGVEALFITEDGLLTASSGLRYER